VRIGRLDYGCFAVEAAGRRRRVEDGQEGVSSSDEDMHWPELSDSYVAGGKVDE
jgi:hypothetical protein